MANFVQKYWPIIFIAGAVLGHLSEHFMNDVEIHWRLFLIMLFTILTLGGYLMVLFSWYVSVGICVGVVLIAFYQRQKRIQ